MQPNLDLVWLGMEWPLADHPAMLFARFVKVYRSDKLCGNDHSYKVCGNAVEKLAGPTNVVEMINAMPYSV